MKKSRPCIKSAGSSAACYTWTARELSATGVLGDPSGATPEKGREWSELVIKAMADLLVEMYHFKRPS
jgi:creatinine amidohydrolase/Fe(II)-dependent formamide hydrolase-like protein